MVNWVCYRIGVEQRLPDLQARSMTVGLWTTATVLVGTATATGLVGTATATGLVATATVSFLGFLSSQVELFLECQRPIFLRCLVRVDKDSLYNVKESKKGRRKGTLLNTSDFYFISTKFYNIINYIQINKNS
jgi:hypothetical protein